MKRITLLICLCTSLFSAGQEKKELDAKSFNNEMVLLGKKMNAEMMSIKFKKEVFKDINSPVVVESANGQIIRGKGLDYKMVNPGMINFQTGKLNVLVDSTERMVIISNVDSSLQHISQLNQIPLDVLKDYKLSKTIFPTYYILRAEPENKTIGILEFYIHKESTELFKFNMFYPPGNYFSESMEDESLESPYLTIIFEPMKKLKETASLISLENILEKKADGEYLLSPKMAGFQLKDTRYKSPK
ncbi:hypothetical protein [uncultured Fluviicola sp.]|uniref:hypothetical protein n=1 Tax=uncultured Fluviicola sp. TaxID=463303 RepID=UPI0025EF2A50|nr:hypothetical protein [uncultured Fluviicola sp.]